MQKRTHTAASTFRAGIVADLHCGSRYALVPPSFRPASSGPSGVFMAYLWECWTDFVKQCPALDLLIVNGDATQGEHPTNRTAPDAIDTSPLHQTDMAIQTLGPLRDKAKRLWVVRGTGFHEGKWNESLERLGRELKAQQWSDQRYSGEVLDGTFAGKTWNVVHAQTHGAIYPGTLMNRTIWFANLADHLAKTVPADIIVRSHTHSAGKMETMGKWIISTRAWQLVSPHIISKMEYYRAQALLDLGGHVVTIGPDGISWRDYPYAPYKPSRPRTLA